MGFWALYGLIGLDKLKSNLAGALDYKSQEVIEDITFRDFAGTKPFKRVKSDVWRVKLVQFELLTRQLLEKEFPEQLMAGSAVAGQEDQVFKPYTRNSQP